MKKFLLIFMAAGLMAGMSACNDSDSGPLYFGFGTYYTGSYPVFTNYDGTTFYDVDDTFPYLIGADYGGTYLMQFWYRTANESIEKGPGVIIPIEFVYNSSNYVYPTHELASKDAISDDAPLVQMNAKDGEPIRSIVCNFLNFEPTFFYFTQNAASGATAAEYKFFLEIDSDLKGSDNDIIDARLKLRSGRASGEVIDTDHSYYVPIAFDFRGVANDLNLDLTKEYTINITYKVYTADAYRVNDSGTVVISNESATEEKTMSVTWEPGNPYNVQVN